MVWEIDRRRQKRGEEAEEKEEGKREERKKRGRKRKEREEGEREDMERKGERKKESRGLKLYINLRGKFTKSNNLIFLPLFYLFSFSSHVFFLFFYQVGLRTPIIYLWEITLIEGIIP